MSEWIIVASTAMTAGATVVIANFTRKTYEVYSKMSEQIGEQIRLTRDIFLESHKPMLSVSITDCVYSEGEQRFKGRITIKNHGRAVALAIDLTMSFGGTNFIKRIDQIAIQPQSSIPFILLSGWDPTNTGEGRHQQSRSIFRSKVPIKVFLIRPILTMKNNTTNRNSNVFSPSSHGEIVRLQSANPKKNLFISTAMSAKTTK